MLGRHPDRFSLCDWPWSAVQQSDLQPQGEPETRLYIGKDIALGLHIRDEAGGSLGMLGVRLTLVNGALQPASMGTAETPQDDAT